MDCLTCTKKCPLQGSLTDDLGSNKFVSWAISQLSSSAWFASMIYDLLYVLRPDASHYIVHEIRSLANQGRLGYRELLIEIEKNLSRGKENYRERIKVIEALKNNDLSVVIDFLDKSPDDVFSVLVIAERLNPMAFEALIQFASEVGHDC